MLIAFSVILILFKKIHDGVDNIATFNFFVQFFYFGKCVNIVTDFANLLHYCTRDKKKSFGESENCMCQTKWTINLMLHLFIVVEVDWIDERDWSFFGEIWIWLGILIADWMEQVLGGFDIEKGL